MLHKDYLMRLLLEYTQTLRYLYGLLKNDPDEKTLAAINEKLEEELNLSKDLLTRMAGGALIDILTMGNSVKLELHRGVYVAALFYAAAQAHQQLSHSQEVYACKVNALHLMVYLALEYPDVPLPEYAPNTADLLVALEDSSLPLSTMQLLFRYYEHIGVYARAEDMLFDLLDEEMIDHAAMLSAGIAFYKRLNELPDEALIAGNLPREELVEGLASLYEMRDE